MAVLMLGIWRSLLLPLAMPGTMELRPCRIKGASAATVSVSGAEADIIMLLEAWSLCWSLLRPPVLPAEDISDSGAAASKTL